MKTLFTFFIILLSSSVLFAQDCECILSSGEWTNTDFMGQNPTLSAVGENWELSSSVWLSTELNQVSDTTINTILYGPDQNNSSILMGDCYSGVVNISINYLTIGVSTEPVGDIEFSIYSDDGFSVTSVSVIESIDVDSEGIMTATGNIVGGPSGQVDEDYTLLNLFYENAMGNSFTVFNNTTGEIETEFSDLNGDGTLEGCFLTDSQNDCFTISIDGGSDFTWSLWAGDILLLEGDDSDFETCDCVDDDDTANSLAAMWNPDINGCVEAVPYFISVGYPCDTDLSVLGMTGTIADICECTCEEYEVEEVFGCTNETACNYDETATEDDGSCVTPNIENGIQCDECCVYTSGTWSHINAFYLAGTDTPTISAEGDSWSLSSAAFLYSEEVENTDGSITTTSWFGSDSSNESFLVSDCFTGEVTLVLIFKTLNDVEIVGDIVIKMFNDQDMYFETITSVDSFDLNTATMTGSIMGGNAGNLIILDSDGDGVGDCDETTSIIETVGIQKELITVINIMGQIVTKETGDLPVLYLYEDGTVVKQYKVK